MKVKVTERNVEVHARKCDGAEAERDAAIAHTATRQDHEMTLVRRTTPCARRRRNSATSSRLFRRKLRACAHCSRGPIASSR